MLPLTCRVFYQFKHNNPFHLKLRKTELRKSHKVHLTEFVKQLFTELKNLSIGFLGHKLPKIMAAYNKHEYLDEKKNALEQWTDKIEKLVTNSNVILLNQTN